MKEKQSDDCVAGRVNAELKKIAPVLSRAAKGDFSESLKVPNNEFKALYESINALLQSAREKTAALNEAKAKDTALLRSLGEGLIVTDNAGVIQIINLRARQLLGIRKDQAVGKPLVDIVQLENERGRPVPYDERPVVQALASGNEFSIENDAFLHYRSLQSGKRFPVTLTASPFVLKGRSIGMVVVFRDSTHERNMSRAKSEFISLASHQLRTPIAIMSLNLEILMRSHKDELPDGPIQDHINEVDLALKRMLKLVNTLLNVSRIELGTLEVVRKEVTPIEIIEASVRELQALANERSLTIELKSPNVPPRIDTDPALLRIVIDNVLTNAIKYSFPDTTIAIVTRARRSNVEIEIRNKGYGIPQDQQHQVFTKMFRGDNVARAGEEGTGLGLYVASSITQKLGGKIWFVSEENKITSFFISFPMLS